MVEYEIVRLSADCCIDGFDCGNSDINGFLAEDAHREAIGLYEKCGFSFFTEKDKDDETRLMYFDLKHFRDAMHDTVNA